MGLGWSRDMDEILILHIDDLTNTRVPPRGIPGRWPQGTPLVEVMASPHRG